MSANENASEPGSGLASNKNLRLGAIILIVVVAAGAIAYVVSNRSGAQPQQPPPINYEITTASGLKMHDVTVGTGASPKMGQTVLAHYVGTLEDGTQFDSSREHGPGPASFSIGPGLIEGWNEALVTMKVGGKRQLFVPSALAYGARGNPPDIPPNTNLLFEIELVDVK